MMKPFVLATIGYFLLTLVIFTFTPFGDNNVLVQKILADSYSLISVFVGILALKAYGFKGNRAVALILIVTGTFGWFLGDVMWNYQEYVLGKIAFPSAGDLFYLLGYLLLFAGVCVEVKSTNISVKTIPHKLLIGNIFVGCAVTALILYISIFKTYAPDSPIFENIVTIGYQVGDILLLVSGLFLVFLVYEYKGGKLAKVWTYLLISFVFTTIADLVYGLNIDAYQSNHGFLSTFISANYFIAYLFMAYAFLTFKISIELLQKKLKQR